MQSDRVKRFKERKKKLSEIKRRSLNFVVDENIVEKHLNTEVNSVQFDNIQNELFEHYENFNLNLDVTEQEINKTLKLLNNEFNKERFDDLAIACKKDVLSAIITPFGLGRLVSLGDKEGGNVTTVNNAKQGVYAEEKDLYSRSSYTKTKNSVGNKFEGNSSNSIGSKFTKSKMSKEGTVRDVYTGKKLKATETSPDHIKSIKSFHDEGGFMLKDQRKADFATDERNLALTDRSINQSMRDYDKKEWGDKISNNRDKTNKEHYEIDNRRLNAAIKRSETVAKKHSPTITEKAKYYTSNISRTGVKEGTKMGFQQAIGLVIYEFFEATFYEVNDIYSNGFYSNFDDNSFFKVLKERLNRVSKKILDKWKDYCKEFSKGFLSGFLSNFVTVIINIFLRTGKRIVRIIREGFFSLLKALKLLCFPPQGMSYSEAAHEATKLIATGVAVVGGIAIEQHIDNMIKAVPVLEFMADILTSVITAALTGLAITFIVYAIDKFDFFKVNDNQRHYSVMDKLEKKLNLLFKESDALIEQITVLT